MQKLFNRTVTTTEGKEIVRTIDVKNGVALINHKNQKQEVSMVSGQVSNKSDKWTFKQ